MFWKYDSGYDSPDASKRGLKTMGMIRGHDSGYDSRQCNVPVVINSVYAVLGNTHMGVSWWNVGNTWKYSTTLRMGVSVERQNVF